MLVSSSRHPPGRRRSDVTRLVNVCLFQGIIVAAWLWVVDEQQGSILRKSVPGDTDKIHELPTKITVTESPLPGHRTSEGHSREEERVPLTGGNVPNYAAIQRP